MRVSALSRSRLRIRTPRPGARPARPQPLRAALAMLAAAAVLSGCSLGGRRMPAPTAGVNRPPSSLTTMDSAAVAIVAAAMPHASIPAGASAHTTATAPAAVTGTATGTTGGATTATGTGMGTPGTTIGRGTTGPRRGTVTTGTVTAPGTAATGTATTGPAAATPTATLSPTTGTATGTGGRTASPGGSTPRVGSTTRSVDWAQIQQLYGRVSTSWTAARATVTSKGASADVVTAVDSLVGVLGNAIRGHSAPRTAMVANDLTATLVALLGLYQPVTPVSLQELEYLGREITIDLDGGRREAAMDSARATGGVWAALRAGAMTRSANHARSVDADVARLLRDDADRAAIALRSDAGTLLRDLGVLTRDYTG